MKKHNKCLGVVERSITIVQDDLTIHSFEVDIPDEAQAFSYLHLTEDNDVDINALRAIFSHFGGGGFGPNNNAQFSSATLASQVAVGQLNEYLCATRIRWVVLGTGDPARVFFRIKFFTG